MCKKKDDDVCVMEERQAKGVSTGAHRPGQPGSVWEKENVPVPVSVCVVHQEKV